MGNKCSYTHVHLTSVAVPLFATMNTTISVNVMPVRHERVPQSQAFSHLSLQGNRMDEQRCNLPPVLKVSAVLLSSPLRRALLCSSLPHRPPFAPHKTVIVSVPSPRNVFSLSLGRQPERQDKKKTEGCSYLLRRAQPSKGSCVSPLTCIDKWNKQRTRREEKKKRSAVR